MGFVNPQLRDSIDTNSVLELAQKLGTAGDPDQLSEEIVDYQVSPLSDFPTLECDDRLDDFWLRMEEVQLTNGQHRFRNISRFNLVALSLPHSNADAERCFSMLKKIEMDTRENLCSRTVYALMTSKMNVDHPCYQYAPPPEVRKSARKACAEYKAQTATPSV
ncbi:hypothetical protein ScPMuIL_011635 [Solemya velum]